MLDTTILPVPVDLLVYTVPEWKQKSEEGGGSTKKPFAPRGERLYAFRGTTLLGGTTSTAHSF